jgi:toxin ParE1/3/4
VKPVAFHPEAEVELAFAVDFYTERRPQLGIEFVVAVERAIRFARENPAAGTQVRGDLRRWLLRRFPYYMLFREEDDQVFVLAIAHQKQKPEYWADRA